MLDDDITPARVIRETWRWLPAGISITVAWSIIALIAAGAIAGICLLLIPAGNAVQQKNIQNGYSNTVNSQGYQANLLSEMNQNLGNLSDLAVTRSAIPASSAEQAVVRAQQMAQLRKFCFEGSQVNFSAGIPGAASVEPDYTRNCAAGAVVADPPLAPPAPN